MKKITIGLDFDGVVAYNPFRIIRGPITYFKRHILKTKRTGFWIPQNWWQRLLWTIMHKSSIFPNQGIGLLRQMSQNSKYEFHLITGRYGFLGNDLQRWLNKNHLNTIFKTINVNTASQQPNVYKEEIINRLGLDIYVEDNLDIVEYLSKVCPETQIFWIYNILDKSRPYKYKFPQLEKALQQVA